MADVELPMDGSGKPEWFLVIERYCKTTTNPSLAEFLEKNLEDAMRLAPNTDKPSAIKGAWIRRFTDVATETGEQKIHRSRRTAVLKSYDITTVQIGEELTTEAAEGSKRQLEDVSDKEMQQTKKSRTSAPETDDVEVEHTDEQPTDEDTVRAELTVPGIDVSPDFGDFGKVVTRIKELRSDPDRGNKLLHWGALDFRASQHKFPLPENETGLELLSNETIEKVKKHLSGLVAAAAN
ncbi:hypothetical protein HK104_009025, partial [Borealophlyctis nickersoniae]